MSTVECCSGNSELSRRKRRTRRWPRLQTAHQELDHLLELPVPVAEFAENRGTGQREEF